ncbi:hypothetical protein Tco_1131679 [Tanacetum coccineum]|uniref:Uncharacterized protein n=1 Tax=Tanacetum coccineum TaxID=301880 RepID=A0ABQ5JCR8_9ASTR
MQRIRMSSNLKEPFYGTAIGQVDQNAAKCCERAAAANLICYLTLDTEENKTILKAIKEANASLTFQELKRQNKP